MIFPLFPDNDLYFLIPAVISQVVNSGAELPIPTGLVYSNKVCPAIIYSMKAIHENPHIIESSDWIQIMS